MQQHIPNPPTPRRLLHTYRLQFAEDGRGPAKVVEFEAFDAAQALILAQKEASDRSAELWCDGHKLCTIRRATDGSWEISGSANPGA